MRRLVFGPLILIACGTTAAQQAPPGLPSARISNVFPTGAKAGPTHVIRAFGAVLKSDDDVTIIGSDLDEPEKLYFSHPGIKGVYIAPPLPPVDPKKKDMPPMVKAAPNGPHKFKVTVAADVPPGTYDLRVIGKYGVSNPRAFVVGNINEVREKEPNNDVPEAQRVDIGTTVNGVLSAATDVDYSVFTGKKGQRVVVSCLASSIDTRATPMIEIFDVGGRKLAVNRNYRDSDAVADVILPEDGDYYIRLFQFAYQGGGADFGYRLTISTGPWIDAVFPPIVEPGKPAQVTLYGRNLPNSQSADGFTVDGRPLEKLTVTITPPAEPTALTRLSVRGRIEPVTALQDGFEYTFKGPNGLSNPVPIYFAREKLAIKKNAGGTTAATAEALPVPCELAGFISRRGDSDWYSFDAKKGEQLYVEVAAERIGTQADFFFSIRDHKDTKRDLSGEQDDDPDSLHPSGFYTRTSDPAPYKFTAPEDGKYYVVVGCREASVLTGPRSTYRLRVSPAKPDFRAVAMPYSRHYQSGANAWQGGTQAYDVYVHRIDGYNGAISIVPEGLPAGVTAKPLTIGPTTRWGVLVLNAAPGAAAFVGPITMKASGTGPDGKPLVREIRPATVTWGTSQPNSNVPVIARLDQSFILSVRPEKAPFTLIPEPANATTKLNGKDEKLTSLTVKQGDKFTVPLKVNWVLPDKQNVTLTAEPTAPNPQNSPVTVQIPTQPTKEKPEGVLNFDVKPTAPPGVYSITVKGVAQVPFTRDPMAKDKKGGNVPAEEFTEPILVTVIPLSVAKVTVGAIPNNTLKLGMSGEMTIKVERQFEYAGEFKVKFTPPMGTMGVTADEVTIPAGKDEVKLVVKAAADAKPGAVSNAVVTVTAVYDQKHTITHEAKVTFTVAK
ncbi:MAG: PPC domain-containing protein [Planctomycetes bacterium]|nr:PPC domain-containing protein [Planctomycetota bacterium]